VLGHSNYNNRIISIVSLFFGTPCTTREILREMLNNSTRKILINTVTREMLIYSRTRKILINTTTREMLNNSTTRKILINSTTRETLINSTTREILINSTTTTLEKCALQIIFPLNLSTQRHWIIVPYHPYI
jgi:hypothetical protein